MGDSIFNSQDKLIDNSSETNSGARLTSSPNELYNLRRIKMPGSKTNLASMEGDLIYIVKKYLEIVGLIVIVWMLGKKKVLFEIQ